MISRSQLKFHETFQPELHYISKIMELAGGRYSGTKFDISQKTGIPTGIQKGKVEPTIKYAAYMGLVEYTYTKGEYELYLTPLGKEIYRQDRYLHEPLSHWVCHYGLCCTHSGAPQWAFLVNGVHYHPNETITSEYLHTLAKQHFRLDISFEELFGVVKRTFTDGCFSDLSFLSWSDTLLFHELPENPELLFVYAYALLKSWESLLVDKNEITVIEASEALHFHNAFGLHNDEFLDILDQLSDHGVVAVNRQLFPATIIRLANAEAIIPKLYSNLL